MSKSYKVKGNNYIDSTSIVHGHNRLADILYPVGSIYMSVVNTNPSNYFGGTWVAWGSGKVPVGVNTSETEFNSVEKTGGAKTHTLTVQQIPSHKHEGLIWANQTKMSGNLGTNGHLLDIGWNTGNADNAISVGNTGGGQAHNNLQPYITCYMWKRTA